MSEINPLVLAMLTPRLRGVLIEMNRLPVKDRVSHFRRWCETQPDGDQIFQQVMAIDPESPCPPGPGLHEFKGN